MKILVTGGGGLIGKFAVDLLVRDGHYVRAVIRNPTEPGNGDLRDATELIVGDAADPALLDHAMRGVDGLLHLAAVPAPILPASEMIAANTQLTVAVLEAAGEAGVKTVVMASSLSVLGMAWSEKLMSPLYLPIDERHPLRPTEGYSLSKECDEAAARMASRRWDMSVVSLRFPFTQSRDAIRERAADRRQADSLAKELWAYLDVVDAARVCELALEKSLAGALPGPTVFNVMADDVLSDRPLRDLVQEWYPLLVPDVDQYSHRGAYNVDAARNMLGFEPEHLVEHLQ